MSTVTLRYLEERLNREAPGLRWQCEPVSAKDVVEGSTLPQQIQVRASRCGIPLGGSPFYLSGECLIRWGVDASASMICNELTPKMAASQRATGLDWDRLAEL
jgi:hypothetical protein